MVRKYPPVDWRPCDDYRALKSYRAEPTPHINKKSQNPHQGSLNKSITSDPVGPSELFRILLDDPWSFGLPNAAQTFQRFVDSVTCELTFRYARIEDILVSSTDAEQHLNRL